MNLLNKVFFTRAERQCRSPSPAPKACVATVRNSVRVKYRIRVNVRVMVGGRVKV